MFFGSFQGLQLTGLSSQYLYMLWAYKAAARGLRLFLLFPWVKIWAGQEPKWVICGCTYLRQAKSVAAQFKPAFREPPLPFSISREFRARRSVQLIQGFILRRLFELLIEFSPVWPLLACRSIVCALCACSQMEGPNRDILFRAQLNGLMTALACFPLRRYLLPPGTLPWSLADSFGGRES